MVAALCSTPRVAHFSALLRRPDSTLRPPAAAGALVRTGLQHLAGESELVLDLHSERACWAHTPPRHPAQHGTLLVTVDRGAVLPDLAAHSVGVQCSGTLATGRAGGDQWFRLPPWARDAGPRGPHSRLFPDAGSTRRSHDGRCAGGRRPYAKRPCPPQGLGPPSTGIRCPGAWCLGGTPGRLGSQGPRRGRCSLSWGRGDIRCAAGNGADATAHQSLGPHASQWLARQVGEVQLWHIRDSLPTIRGDHMEDHFLSERGGGARRVTISVRAASCGCRDVAIIHVRMAELSRL